VGDWDVTVLSATSDATAAVLAENEFNEPPADGHQFYIVELSVTYQGNESEAPFVGLTITSVGDSAVAYDAFEAYCGVIPNELDTFSEVFPGGTQNRQPVLVRQKQRRRQPRPYRRQRLQLRPRPRLHSSPLESCMPAGHTAATDVC
jgi:hypothetical protein